MIIWKKKRKPKEKKVSVTSKNHRQASWLTLNMAEGAVAVAIPIVLVIAVVAGGGGITTTQADGNTHKAGKDDEQTANGYQHNPCKLHAENEILCWVWKKFEDEAAARRD